jgi:thimet oligopeptidase
MCDNKITSANDVCQLFPKSAAEIREYASLAIERAQKELDVLLDLALAERTFENTARAFDSIGARFGEVKSAIHALEMVSPHSDVRDACHQEAIRMSMFAVDAFSNKKIYYAFKDFVNNNGKTEQLNNEQKYFLQEAMRDFKRQGFDLSDDEFDAVKTIKKTLSETEMEFDKNIAEDASKINVSRAELEGCDQHFIDHLNKDYDGLYMLGCDYPTYFEIMENCRVESTRKKLYLAFNNRAYPQNVQILDKIVQKRDELAHKLGFDSYAALDIDSEMAQTPEQVERFVENLAVTATKKMEQEFKTLLGDLPADISLDEKRRFKPWDMAFIKAYYKKKYFDLDERVVAEYFPAAKTLQGVFDMYQRFLGLKFALVKPAWSWHDDVQLIEIRDNQTDALRGYIWLDLYPRDNKYSHACHCGIVSPLKMKNADGNVYERPSVALVIANFPKATSDRPALLKHRDVETFFHEFGHAMHFVLGYTEMNSFAGYAVKTDFVEMPSQMFEEWMFDKQLLQTLSGHYQTGKPLPDALIDTMINLKKFDSGFFVVRQCMLSLTALELYKKGGAKNSDKIVRSLAERLTPQVAFEPDAHFQASFGHLTGYGAKYYSYMWSKVYALDMFYMVKEQGLLNPDAGRKLATMVLAKGGSVDPNIILKDYLGREPSQDAFFKDLGFTA